LDNYYLAIGDQKMEPKTVLELLCSSLQNIAIFDSDLLERKVREECVNHRLAFYIEAIYEKIVKDDRLHCIDLEYNKNVGPDDKKVKDENGNEISIRPDIIVHKRESNNDNLIAIEAKYESNSKHDILKLSRLLDAPYNYSYSVAINYNPGKNYFSLRLFWKNEGLIKKQFDIEKNTNHQNHLNDVTLSLYTGK
jgi:hypothetical protein